MRLKYPLPSKILLPVFAVVFSASALAQQSATEVVNEPGVPDDWTHHRLVFSDPGSEQDAIHNGASYEWSRIVNDPRYVMQQLKRGAPAQGSAAQDVTAIEHAAQGAGELTPGSAYSERSRTSRPKIDKDWSMDLGAGTVGAGQYPAKYSFSTTNAGNCASASTPDYVVYNTGVAGASGTQANIIGYDNIYPGCTPGTVPKVYWSYYTGTGSVLTSPVLSGDGTKVAFVESGNPSGSSTLRILKFKSGQGTDYKSPVAPDKLYTNTTAGNGGNTAWSTCPTGNSCLVSVAFQTQTNTDTISAPFYDYASDTLWVGDSSGYLHKFTNVFLGSPGEVTSGGWPVDRSSCNGAVASPVYDSTHSLIFVGDFCGGLDAITSSGSVTSSAAVGTGGPDIDEAPLVDPAAGEVYLFVTRDSTSSCSSSRCSGVFQFPYNFASNSSGNGEAKVGTGSNSRDIYAGTFDNAYFTSSSSSSPTGHLWVCGDTGGNPALYPITITNGTMTTGTITAATTVSATGTTCSPVTEFCNNGGAACTSSVGTDYIFVSPQTEPSTGFVSGCSASTGCVISYTVSGTTATLKAAGAIAGGASGMIVDTQNTSGSLTTNNLYFGTLSTSATCAGVSGPVGNGTGGCAIQALQTAP